VEPASPRAAGSPASPGAPGAAPPQAGGAAGGEATSPQHEPEIVHTGKAYRLDFAAASARYRQGRGCAGDDSPETVIGAPDQKNEMRVGKDRIVTYGYRFPSGTLLLRCRADRVELLRILK
jgi:hypothetical protein